MLNLKQRFSVLATVLIVLLSFSLAFGTHTIIKVPLYDGNDTADIEGINVFDGEANELQLINNGGVIANTVLMLHFEGNDDEETFTDSSFNMFTVTSVGGAKTEDTQFKFGATSGFFNGTTAYLTAPDQPDYDFADNDFTIEWWEYRTSNANGKCAIGRDATSTFAGFLLGYSNGSAEVIYMSSNGSSFDIASAVSFGASTLNQWNHFAVTRSGSDIRLYKNGNFITKVSSAAAVLASSNALSIGRVQGTNYYAGYIDELRITTGQAIWTTETSFTVPAAPYNPYPSDSPSPTSYGWIEMTAGDIVNTDTFTAYSKLDGTMLTSADNDVEYRYYANGGSASGWLTLDGIRNEPDITVTNAAQALKVDVRLNSDGTNQTAVQAYGFVNVSTTEGGGGQDVIFGM